MAVGSVFSVAVLISVTCTLPSSWARRRDYFLSAEEQWWDFVPTQLNLVNNDRRYTDDVLSVNNASFCRWIPLIYPPELEIKEITESNCFPSFLDLHLQYDKDGHLSTKIYDKRDNFNFQIINFPNLESNIPTSPAYDPNIVSSAQSGLKVLSCASFFTCIFDDVVLRGEERIGSVYKKVMIKQYTDATYTKEIRPEPWRGFVGPLLKGEVGDTLYVHFRNLASRPYSLHPHGVQYFKDSEGALYADGTSGSNKFDDQVPPGSNYRYRWFMAKSFAPTADDDNCLPLGYHPHIRSHRDIDTGLIGMMVVCKPGILRPDGSRKDVDKEFVLFADITNETNSWLIEENLNRCQNPSRCQQLFDENNAAFVNSNLKYQINGYSFGNLPDFPVYEGERVVFYAMGLNLGIHVVGVQSHTMVSKHHRVHGYPFGIAWFEGLYMNARNVGRWLIFCKVSYHFEHGMAAYVNVMPGLVPQPRFVGKRTRRYYIAIEKIIWDFRPSGRVLTRVGKSSPDRSRIEESFFSSEGAVGGRFVKAVFREYSDGTFRKLVKRTGRNEHLGILGPPIKVEVFENLEVVLLNKADRPFSFNPFGLSFNKENEGAVYKSNRKRPQLTGAVAEPGKIKEYFFTVPPDYGPTELDPQCITETYQSFVHYSRDMYSGLVGPLLICKPGVLDIRGNQRAVNKEYYLMLMNWIEMDSWYFNESVSIAKPLSNGMTTWSREANTFRAINGRVYGNIGGFDMCVGDLTSWHMVGFGERFDVHTVVFQGNNLRYDGRNVNFVSMYPGIGVTAIMAPDNPGHWLFHCGSVNPETFGMVTGYNVGTCDRPQITVIPKHDSFTVRKFYIAAVEVEWDYAPSKMNPMTGENMTQPNTQGNIFVRDDDQFIGSRYKKAVYREFYDETFTVPVQRSKKDLHLGILGPYIRAEVGDVIEIVYKNMAAFENSIYLNNLPLDTKMAGKHKFGVRPGEIHTFRWRVPERSGPGAREPNCIGHSYFSKVYPARDINTGLMGPFIICRKGVLDAVGRRIDNINRELTVAFVIFNETNSHYYMENVRTRAPGRTNLADPLFAQSNTKFSMNGFIFQNIPGLVMEVGDKIAWYTYSLSILGLHSNHFHGQTFIRTNQIALRDDVVGVSPGSSETVEMRADNPGTWLIHCHFGLHMRDGMSGVYTILPNSSRGPYFYRYKN